MMTTTSSHTDTSSTEAQARPWLLPLALAAAAAISAVALFDAFTRGLTGEFSAFQGEVPWLTTVAEVIHGVGYMVLALVLFLNGHSIDGRSRVVPILRWALLTSVAALGIVFLGGLIGDSPVTEFVANFAFIGLFLFSAALGIGLLATGRRTPAAFVLTGVLAAIALMFLLGAVAPAWVHPAYPETAAHFGMALLALPQPRRRRRN